MKNFIFLSFMVMTAISCSVNEFQNTNDDYEEFRDDGDEVGRSISSKADEMKEEYDLDEDSFLKNDEADLFADDRGDGIFIEETIADNKPDRSYRVKSGDTLMWIAFKLYGDYSKWRELRSDNYSTIDDYNHLKEGLILKIRKTGYTYIRPQGKPYFIKNGDSLSKISGKVYGSIFKWERIWKNNLRQIKNPNLIFAGFTLFYKEDNGINLAFNH